MAALVDIACTFTGDSRKISAIEELSKIDLVIINEPLKQQLISFFKSINDDCEKDSALRHLLSNNITFTEDQLNEIISFATSINNDHHKASALDHLLSNNKVKENEGLLKKLIEIAQSIQDSSHRKEVLDEIETRKRKADNVNENYNSSHGRKRFKE